VFIGEIHLCEKKPTIFGQPFFKPGKDQATVFNLVPTVPEVANVWTGGGLLA
jgi:hypothetical protein